MKGCILPFPKKGDLGLAKNYRGITLTSIAAKIYNALLRNRIEPKIDNILRKNQNGFRRNRSTTSQILTIRRILEGVRAKNLQETLIFVDFTKAFDSIHRGKMEQILLAYGIPKETVAAITILYRNTKVKVRSPDGDIEYFDIVAGVLQGDTLAPYLFIICLDYVLRTSIDKIKENGFELTKKRSRRYPATTITDADYADDIAILANTHDQAETLLHSLERAAASIGLYVNAHQTEYMCYNQTGDISTLEGTPLKLVDKFPYLGSSVESTEKDIETRLTKAWTAINRLSIIWKSDLTDKMKRSFFQAAVTSILLYGCTTWTLTKRLEKKLDGNYTRMMRAILNKSWQQHPTRHQLYGHLPPITKIIQVRRTRLAGHCWRSRDELIRDVLLWIPTHGRAKAGRPARTYIQQLYEDTGCCPEDLPRAMNDREEWRERVRDIRATSAIWWWWLCEREFEITNLRKKIPVDAYINWPTRIRYYVLTQKNPTWSIHQLANDDPRLPTHAKKSHLIHTSFGGWGFEITYTRKKSQLIHISTGKRGLEVTCSRKNFPVDSYINRPTRIRDYVLTQKHPSCFIDQLANEDSRLRTHANNQSCLIHQLVNEDSRLRTHATNSCLFIYQLADKHSRLRSRAKNNSWFIHQLPNEDSRFRTQKKTFWFIHQLALKIRDDILMQIAQSIHINGLTQIRFNYM